MGYEKNDDYIEVAERIAEFREKHPEGSLRPVDPAHPYTLERVGDKTYVVVTAAAYRTPTDLMPGIGMAWEPYPGRTPFTKDSELQNAETSAWGRAIVAALAGDTKRGIATAQEVRNRSARSRDRSAADQARDELKDLLQKRGGNLHSAVERFKKLGYGSLRTSTSAEDIRALIDTLEKEGT